MWIFTLILYFFSLLMIMFSTNVFFMWFSLEFNLFLFMFLAIKNSNNLSNMIKYFIIQSILSFMLVFSLILSKELFGFLIFLMKVGVPPFHIWFFDIIKFLEKFPFFILMTLQKYPLLILMKLSNLISIMSSNLFLFLVIWVMFGSIMSLSQVKLKYMLFFSSFNYNSWFLLALYFNTYVFNLYFILYTISFWFLVKSMSESTQIVSFKFAQTQYFWFFIILGLPPSSFFFAKWMILFFLMKYSLVMFLFFSMAYILSIYFYVSFFMTKYSINANHLKFFMSKKETIISQVLWSFFIIFPIFLM